MPVAALEHLPRFQPRRFVPEDCDLGAWAQIEPLFLKLEAAALELTKAKELERWVYSVSELGAALHQEESRRYVNMTCQTDDAAAEKAYLHYVEEITPRLKPHMQRLRELFMACPYRARLSRYRWEVFNRETAKDVALFRQDNVPLQTEEEKLCQQYQKITGAQTVTFQGQERTLQQMGPYLEDPSRALREEAWRLVAARRLADRERLEELFDALLALRGRIASQAGFPDYRAYAFQERSRFDYTPDDCATFHAAVAEFAVPLARALQARRQRLLGLERLRPWDLAVDARGRPPLKPFANSAELIEKTHAVFRRIDPALGQDFALLRQHELLDLDSRKGKAPGGYQESLEEARLPFIFMNAVGLQRDVEVLLHEGGHAFHALSVRDEPLLLYRHAPLEFCEVASMTMELLAHPHLGEFYSPLDAARARRAHLEGIVSLLPWIAIIDAFQHWIYTHPGHTREERRAQWLELLGRFGGIEDWSGLEDARGYMWHRQIHLFQFPFYYIEYGIAQLGALQIWRHSQKDLDWTVIKYRRALELGRFRPLPELFAAAGIRFDFSARTVKPLLAALEKELKLHEAV